ncbi:dihydrolipoamide acetyltransferase family protein [Roseovarius indicus]|uniref:Dihydrolipoamide acetyltransferase component of pyruvate dehydrogenase complex n=1 Tax=Roseovarius indicus TaxID=540747 RepID=A0A0T5P2G2_9RHOB|nr:dihydrolipoamide acetyltransferase family protein [Roseovarius indicus]KRS15303.1 branched-chain alpha-keto acid dehydrogenase subunit E2 [Roseovarius indicus]QEW25038.1 Lipoamide acyltransferase component of branched-chain alpha-keto acid dehydrogenase complex [Roseovarius indicus]SFE39558.1 2-oxoisovalerate dehydrogenase E2 component (dihydrolipoyl transacylase) [Roseovarius indicus]
MTEQSFKLPDIGEGITEAELSEWLVKVGDEVREDDPICEVTTDKATVEIPAAATGRVTWVGGEAGDVLAVGSELIRIETDGDVAPSEESEDPAPEPAPKPESEPEPETPAKPAKQPEPPAKPARRAQAPASATMARNAAGRPLAAPSVRGRALEMGIDLRQLRGTGPAGRILHEDLDAYAESGGAAAPGSGLRRRDTTEEVRITGVRRKISERMSLAKARIPHFSIIEEVEVDALEDLRASLNARFADKRGKLTLLPFVIRALSEAVLDHPEINAHFDDEASVVTRHAALHCGIATQTDTGLMVPVLQHAEAMDLWEAARDVRRLSDSARERRISPENLSGSTITITSLGPLGALATTPIINHPEVAIVGINKIAVRPVWDGHAFQPRRVMNLSCSFDHRVVDGWVAAEFVAKLKALLETPAMLWMEWRDD